MKKHLVFMTALLLWTGPAQASVFDLETTGNRVEKFFGQGFGPVFSPVTPGNPIGGYIGGPAGNDSEGYAFEFTVTKETFLKQLVYDISVSDYYTRGDSSLDAPESDYLEFDWKIYSGPALWRDSHWKIPDAKTLIALQHVSLVNPTPGEKQFNDLDVDFDILLAPGTYWLAYEQENTDDYSRAHSFISDVHGLSIPEPSTMALLGLGLIGLRRRKKIQDA